MKSIIKTEDISSFNNKNPEMNLKGEFADSNKTSKTGISFILSGGTLYKIAKKIKVIAKMKITKFSKIMFKSRPPIQKERMDKKILVREIFPKDIILFFLIIWYLSKPLST